MVLHHVEPLDKLTGEISRCLKTTKPTESDPEEDVAGRLFIRDHTPYSDLDKMLIDIEHMIYSTLENTYEPEKYYGCYLTSVELNQLLSEKSLKFVKGDDFFSKYSNLILYNRAFWAEYTKV
jgi:hypothetical protein